MIKHLVVFIALALSTASQAQNWQGLGSGLNYSVTGMFTDTVDNLLYVGGQFSMVDGKNFKGFAKWDGTKWDSVGLGINYNVMYGNTFAIARYNNEIYVGGNFENVGGIPSNYIGKWNGAAWDSLPESPNSAVVSFMVYNNELYVGGLFTMVGSDTAYGIAKWNGSTWSKVGDFPFIGMGYANIAAIAAYNGEIYVGGIFQDSTGYPVNIAKYNGSTWHRVGNGIVGSFGAVNALAVYNGELYAGGLFYKGDGNPGNHIAKWNGTTWSDAGGGMGGVTYPQVRDIKVHNNELYAVGVFTTAGGVPADRVAKWNGTDWCGLGSDFDVPTFKLEFYRDTLYVGGDFTYIDSAPVNRIAKWTGGSYVDTCGNTTGIEETAKEDYDVRVYPNPFNTSTTIEVTGAAEPFNFILYDQLGREVRREELTANHFELYREGLSEGIYFYSLTNKRGIIARGKLIIQ